MRGQVHRFFIESLPCHFIDRVREANGIFFPKAILIGTDDAGAAKILI